MKYDPIMCMMVDDSVKTEDAVPNGWKVTLEQNRNKHYVYSKAMTAKGAELEAKKEYPDATVLNVERHNVSDKKTIDHAIRSCDSREDDIADELFDALQQIGKRNINKNEAEFISEKFFDGKVSSDELMRIFNKYKKEYL